MPKKRTITTYTIDELSPAARKRAIDLVRDEAFDDHDAQLLTKDFQEILDERGLKNAKVNWGLGYCQGDGVCFSGTVYIPKVIRENKLTQFEPLIPLYQEDNLHARVHHKDSRDCHWNSMTIELELNGEPKSFLPTNLRSEMRIWQDEQVRGLALWQQEAYLTQMRNREPILRWEKDLKDWEYHVDSGPREWSPRFRHPGIKPAPLNEPVPPKPVFPMPTEFREALDAVKVRWDALETLSRQFEKWLEEWVQNLSRELEKIGYAEIEYRQSDEAIAEFLNANEMRFLKDGKELVL